MKSIIRLSALVLAVFSAGHASASAIVVGSVLSGTQKVTFDEVQVPAGGVVPFDGTFVSGGVSFSSHFLGQTNTDTAHMYPGGVTERQDTLSGTPSAPLTLASDGPGKNLGVFVFGSNVLGGLGPAGGLDFGDSVGFGSISALFAAGQSEFGVDVVGGNGGTFFVSFWDRSGALIESVALKLPGTDSAFGPPVSFTFARVGGISDIAGVSMYSADRGGIAIDNVLYTATSPGDVPEPSSIFLAGLALAALVASRRKVTA